MDSATLLSKIKSHVREAEEVALKDPKWIRNEEPHIRVPAAKIRQTAEHLRDELGFDLLSFVTAVDWVKEGRFELVYYVMKSSDPREKFFLKADLPREAEPSAPSVAAVWAGADWQEREIYDLYGIRFEGHPNLKRILLWEGFPGWPLRKDYVHVPDKYDNGFEIGLPGKTFAETPAGGSQRHSAGKPSEGPAGAAAGTVSKTDKPSPAKSPEPPKPSAPPPKPPSPPSGGTK